MSEYTKEEIKRIEEKWRKTWQEKGTYRVSNDSSKPKYYVLDMFPYPSGAGLHVGHPLGYIASDIVARFKRLKGFNVLHPMGFDAFGLPAEQYAIQTGQHPRVTTEKNIETFKRQLGKIGFSFDWDREVITSDPGFYKWTQWIFMQLFNSWYNKRPGIEKTVPILTLIDELKRNGNGNILAACDEDTPIINAGQWLKFNDTEKENFLQKYRIAYMSEAIVNWCPGLRTVLSNDEVKDGVSERGGYPVERKKMLQWSMRISAYAERLLSGLDMIDWPEPLKEMQRNWIGKSVGCELDFKVEGTDDDVIRVFTTRIDTIYGVTFMVIAPEHDLLEKITASEQKDQVTKYVEVAKNRSERERMSEVKHITGVFTGAFVINPFNNEKVPVWIADYVLAGYGTGAVMAVPSSDTRDHAFARYFNLPILDILEGPTSDITKENFDPKSGKMINSGFLNGLDWKDAIERALQKVEELGIGVRKVNYRMRDAIFGRQRYWGEPFPVYYKDGLPRLVNEEDLPITLPEIDEYKPTETGGPPLGRAKYWLYRPAARLTLNPSPEERDANSEKGTGFQTSEKKYWHILKQYSRENRQNATEEEEILWQKLRNRQLGNYKIRRQHAIGIFIADFVCLDKRTVIEVDGEYHLGKKDYDQARTEYLNDEGFSVIRFTNADVKSNLDNVLSKIKSTLDSTPSIANSPPSPAEKGPGDEAFPFELTTMPGWAGSSWYWFRYMDPKNDEGFVSKKAEHYWKEVDLYIGGSEHATGHLLYSRFWCKALKDLGYVEAEEPFKKLINQGHIQGNSKYVFGLRTNSKLKVNALISFNIKDRILKEKLTQDDIEEIKKVFPDLDFSKKIIHNGNLAEGNIPGEYTMLGWWTERIPLEFVNDSTNELMNKDGLSKWNDELKNVVFIEEGGKYVCGTEVEKMSKSRFNVVNPDDIIDSYGADTLRMYEMFLGPLEQSKPWNTNGIDGVYKFLRRFWNLLHDSKGNLDVSTEAPTRDELKVLHRTIRKIEQDINNYSFNTSVSEFMICSNELSAKKCNKRAIIEPLVIALSPFAPHISEELWSLLGHKDTVFNASFPKYDEQYLTESSFNYPISINGKVRTEMNFALDMPREDIEKQVLASEIVKKWTEGKPPKKIIVVQGRIVNVVV